MRHTQDLTQGNIYRELWLLTLPLLLGNILQQFYNAADAWIVGRFVGQDAFAAVGVGGTVMNLFIFILSGCCAGFSVLFAQLYGAGDLAAFRKEGFLSVAYGGGAAAALSALALAFLSPLLRLIQTPPEVAEQCGAYLAIVCCGLIATYYYNLCAAILRAVGNTSAALAILFAAMALNIVLDLWFVAGMNWSRLGHGHLSGAFGGAVLPVFAKGSAGAAVSPGGRGNGRGAAEKERLLRAALRSAPVQPVHRQAAGAGSGELHGHGDDCRVYRHHPH